MELDEVLSRVAADGIEFVRFEQSDLHGISRSKTVPARHAAAFARDGLNFLLGQLGFDAQGGVAPGTPYLETRGFPDSLLFPDPDSYAVLPWAESTARLLCTPHFFDGAPVPAAPRLAMQRVCDALADEGYLHRAGYEYELYLVGAADRRPPFDGIQIFATLRNNFDDAFIRRILRSMPTVGVDVITANAEYGPGQDDTTPGRLSEVGRWWVGGQLAHLPALTAFFAPTVNCGKRFKQWSFAPVNATWALENRSVAIRVKGLDGIRNRIEPPAALDGVAYGIEGPVAIPTRLEAALDELEKDTTLRELLGEELVATFLAVKRHEVAKAAEHVRDDGAADWLDRVDEFEIDELFEFL
jgi:glutamine synthetase